MCGSETEYEKKKKLNRFTDADGYCVRFVCDNWWIEYASRLIEMLFQQMESIILHSI